MVRALRMASPLSQPERVRRFDETGGAQRPRCGHSSEKQVAAKRITAGRATVEMYGRLHLPARLVPRHR